MAFIFTPDGNISAVDLGNQKNIDKKIQSAPYSSEQNLSDSQDLWDQVSNLILRPIMPKLISERNLLSLLDAKLNLIPLGTLRFDKKYFLG